MHGLYSLQALVIYSTLTKNLIGSMHVFENTYDLSLKQSGFSENQLKQAKLLLRIIMTNMQENTCTFVI